MKAADLVVTRSGVRFMGRRFACSIGYGGVSADKKEGDGATPAGSHCLVGCLYRPDRLSPPNPGAVPIRPGDGWSDDSTDPHYNSLVRAPHRYSHENLRRADPMYDVILLTDWNLKDAVPGRGSAIFIHRWRKPGHPTAGCVAFSAVELHWIATRITPLSRLIVR